MGLVSPPAPRPAAHGPGRRPWALLTNHAAVLLAIAEDPTVRLRDLATRVQVTEPVAQRIVRELVEGGFLERHRAGRRNVYRVLDHAHLRHPNWSDLEVHGMLAMVGADQAAEDG
jgi:DNA-binding MarR family transcriptional regulator